DPWEVYIDDLSAQGMVQITATHNWGSLGTHAISTLAAGASRDLSIQVASNSVNVLYITIRWRGGSTADISGVVVTPGGTQIPMAPMGQNGSLYAVFEPEQSTGGTSMMAGYVLDWPGGPSYNRLSGGTWTMR